MSMSAEDVMFEKFCRATKAFILWDGRQLGLRRLILDSSFSKAELILSEAVRLGLPIITDFVDMFARPGDLWVGLRPFRGYHSDENRDEIVECDELPLVLRCLVEAKPVK